MNTQPKQVPFLMSTEMVQAILAGRKTQTRRIIKPQPDDTGLHDHTRFPMAMNSDLEGWWGTVDETGESRRFKPKCEVGDLIWVRETFRQVKDFDGSDIIAYKADFPFSVDRWDPSIHMPKSAARIWLRCTGVKAERVQDISQAFAQLWQSINGRDSWEANPWVWAYSFEVVSTNGKPENI